MSALSSFAAVAACGVVLGGSVLAVPKARAVVVETRAEQTAVRGPIEQSAPAVWRRYEWRPWTRQYPQYRGYSERFRFAPRWQPRDFAGRPPRYGHRWDARPGRPYGYPHAERWRPEWRPDWRRDRQPDWRSNWSYGSRRVGGDYDWRYR